MDNENKDFDPSLSDGFYNNLEEAIGDATATPDEDFLPELELGDDLFAIGEGADESQPLVSLEEELFAGVNAALSEQIDQEFGREPELSSAEEREPNKFVAGWRAIPKWTKILVSVILVILISVGLLFGTERGRNLVYKAIVGFVFDNWFTEDPEDVSTTPIPEDITISVTPEPTADPNAGVTLTPEPTLDPNAGTDVTPEPTQNPDITPEPEFTPTPTPTEVPSITIMDDEDIINILLIGEENKYNATNGRADAMILVSINLDGGPIKLVSFLRDTYVEIPGKSNDKLNASLSKGGARLTMETIEKNFGVDVDAYVKVNFAGFENIIDSLGGLKLSLTATESDYLNYKSTYISKPEERNTVAGMQTMTGSQVLGYCRVRKVQTSNGLNDDPGRNYRLRTVAQAIFDQYAPKNPLELASIMTKSRQLKGYVTVSSNLEELAIDCLQTIVENQMFDVKTLQIPKQGMWWDETIGTQEMVVFSPENIDVLQNFLYGEE